MDRGRRVNRKIEVGYQGRNREKSKTDISVKWSLHYGENRSKLRLFKNATIFCVIVFINEADTLHSSLVLIYSEIQMGLYTQLVWQEAA